MDDVFEQLERAGTSRALFFSDAESGLRAVLVIDDLTLGPAAGGVRTRAYSGTAEAIADAAALARAMTVKCALAGLDAGGGKAVVIDHPGLDRARAFEVLGRRIEELGGIFRTAGDLGTGPADLAAMARATRYVHTEETDLAAAVARGLVRCVEACARVHSGADGLDGLRIAIQGAGAIGSAAARALVAAGAIVTIADVDTARARRAAVATGAEVTDPALVLRSDADVIVPCAIGGVIDESLANDLRAWAVSGAANNLLTGDAAAEALLRRGILHVPDVIASAGAVIEGIGRSVMGLADRAPLIDGLGKTAETVLRRARSEDRTPSAIALEIARDRIAARARSST